MSVAAPFLSSSWHRVAGIRPKLRQHASVSRHRYRGGSWYVLHDHTTGRTYRLSAASYLIVGGMDGVRTIDQIWQDAATRLGQEAPSQDEVIQLLAQLYSAELLQSETAPDSIELLHRSAKIVRTRWVEKLFNPLALRMRLWNPDKFLERTSVVTNCFGWSGLLLWVIVVLPAVVLGLQHWSELSDITADRILAADNIILMAVTFVVLKLFHELGHAYAIKTFGGMVYEIGVMLLFFAPLPYVDASAASQFRSKWQRALVGAAGMIVEVFLASIALYVWLSVEQGLVRALAYDVIIVAGVSTIIFNGNPLLRYDGYYILSDLIEIPNLAQRASRYWAHIISKYVLGADGLPEFMTTRGERGWLLFYAPAAFAYRTFVMFAIAIFVASEYLAIGVAIAIWALVSVIALPIGKALWRVVAGAQFQRNRVRAVSMTLCFISIVLVVLLGIPAPLHTTTEGVIWLPEAAIVRAGTGGFVNRLVVDPGRIVAVGDALVESDDPALKTAVDVLRARVAELETTLASERFTDRVKAEITATELGQARAELATATIRAERLIARSRADGVFTVIGPQDLPGRFMKEGQLLGYVLPQGSRVVRAAITQDDIDLVRHRLRSISVKLTERMDGVLPARIIREVPAGREDLPSKALGGAGGGDLPVDPRDPEGTKTLQRIFQIDLELPDAESAAVFGGRAYVRFDHDWEPIGEQIWRRARQLLLSRLHT
ncbi:MAG: peptidase M50 [Xanthobacteraceae bacterium]